MDYPDDADGSGNHSDTHGTNDTSVEQTRKYEKYDTN